MGDFIMERDDDQDEFEQAEDDAIVDAAIGVTRDEEGPEAADSSFADSVGGKTEAEVQAEDFELLPFVADLVSAHEKRLPQSKITEKHRALRRAAKRCETSLAILQAGSATSKGLPDVVAAESLLQAQTALLERISSSSRSSSSR